MDTLEVRVESTLKSNHNLDSSLGASIDGLDGFGEIGSNGFFAKDMLAIGGTSLNLLGMETRGRANPDGVNLRVGDNIHSIAGESGDVVLGGSYNIQEKKGTEQVSEELKKPDQFHSRKKLILTSFSLGDGGVGHDDGVHTGALADGFQMHNTDTAATNQTDLDDLFGFAFFCVHGER